MNNRKGMTLVELLVVMSIMLIMAAITATFYPSISSDNQISQTANKIQSALAGSRQKARRDHTVTGIRFLPDATNANISTQMMLIQKPVDLVGSSFGYIKQAGNSVSFCSKEDGTVPILVVQPPFEDLVIKNDILVMNPSNNVTRFLDSYSIDINFYNPSIVNPTNRYKIIRQPRVIPGEEAINLAVGYEVILITNQTGYKGFFGPPALCYDVCFDTNGTLYQIDFAKNVYIWVHKSGSSTPVDDAIISVQRNTGKVGVFPVNTAGSNPFSFADDITNEGL